MKRTRLLVLANSWKNSGHCLAGREVVPQGTESYRLGAWLRPVTRHGGGELDDRECLFPDGRPVSVRNFVDVELDASAHDRFQPENWRLHQPPHWHDVTPGFLPPGPDILEERPPDLWLEPGGRPDRVSHERLGLFPPSHSLYVIRPRDFHVCFHAESAGSETHARRRCRFHYRDQLYEMALTDPVINARYASLLPRTGESPVELRLPCGDNLLVCVSLTGDFHGHHYKVVATVFEGGQ